MTEHWFNYPYPHQGPTGNEAGNKKTSGSTKDKTKDFAKDKTKGPTRGSTKCNRKDGLQNDSDKDGGLKRPCSGCGVHKLEMEYTAGKATCDACLKKMRQYYQKNRQKIIAQKKKYRAGK